MKVHGRTSKLSRRLVLTERSSALKGGALFPPIPRGLKGRRGDLSTLVRAITRSAPARVALVGSGGSGKSTLAAALGHRLSSHFRGQIEWFRVGAWDFPTLTEMFSLRFLTRAAEHSSQRVRQLRRYFSEAGPRLIVLDNHEDDKATAQLLEAFRGLPITFVITARRCLLAGLLIFPVAAPLATLGHHAFPRVRSLTRLLRFNPLALDIADGIVMSGAASVSSLRAFLERHGIERVVAIAHEDDLPEVGLLVKWAWDQLQPESRQMLTVLAHVEGDHMDGVSLAKLARAEKRASAALDRLKSWRLVQQPLAGRFILHAVVRQAVRQRRSFDQARFFKHYVGLIEQQPELLWLEQTHLFAAMDYAHRAGDIAAIRRVEQLLESVAKPPAKQG